MPTPNTPDATLLETLALVRQHDGNVSEAARAAGIPRPTLQARHSLATNRFPDWRPGEVAPEALPPKDLPFEDRLAAMKTRNAMRIAHTQAQDWQRVHMPVSGPYALCWFGDPHLDDPYCDLDAVERHSRICAETDGMFGINGGDSINNWVGRLKALYADQPATAEEGWELVDWLLNGLGVRWAAWLLGNHDAWEMGFRIFDKMNTNRVLMRDWEAKLTLVSPDGAECKIWARHDFKGQSIYNELHGQKRAAMFSGGIADIYAAFHRHTYGTSQHELECGKDATLIRARGYKASDHYAMLHGFHEQRTGQSVVTVIEPRKGLQPKINVFRDVQDGADFLTAIRRRVAA